MGDLERCHLEDDTWMLSVGTTDAPASELFSLEEPGRSLVSFLRVSRASPTKVREPRSWIRRAQQTRAPSEGRLQMEEDAFDISRSAARTASPPQILPRVSIFQGLAEMWERVRRFGTMLRGEALLSAGATDVSIGCPSCIGKARTEQPHGRKGAASSEGDPETQSVCNTHPDPQTSLEAGGT